MISGCGSGEFDESTRTTVSGTVLDTDGDPIEGAKVTIQSDPVTETTDKEGKFREIKISMKYCKCCQTYVSSRNFHVHKFSCVLTHPIRKKSGDEKTKLIFPSKTESYYYKRHKTLLD